MRTQECREAMEKVADLCDIKPKTIARVDPVTILCKAPGNEPLRHCATSALEPIADLKDQKIKKAVVTEANRILCMRDDKGGFIKDRLTRKEVEAIIEKYKPSSKKADPSDDRQVRYRLNKQQQVIIKRLVSLKCANDERSAFILIFKWAAERLAKQK